MNKFICLNCNMEFKRKSHLDQHNNRKYPCVLNNIIKFPRSSKRFRKVPKSSKKFH